MNEILEKFKKITGLTDLTEEEAENLLKVDAVTLPSQIVLSIDHARTTSVQYNTNRYSAQVTIDLGPLNLFTSTIVNKKGTSEEDIKRLSRMFIGIVISKYEKSEAFIRDCLNKAEAKDGIRPIGKQND